MSSFPDLPHIQVPPTTNPLDEEVYAELRGLVDPSSSTSGKHLYRRTVHFGEKVIESLTIDLNLLVGVVLLLTEF